MGGFDGSNDRQQRFKALHRANRVRLARAEMKQRICAGALSAAEVILECSWQAENMSVSDILISQKRWGVTRSRRLLLSVGIPEDKRVGTLTERQRVALVRALGGTVPDDTTPPGDDAESPSEPPDGPTPAGPGAAPARVLSPV